MRYQLWGTSSLIFATTLLQLAAQTPPAVSFAVHSFSAAGEPRSVATGDFNGDGAPDFVVANLRLNGSALSGVAAFYNNGDGTFGAPRTTVTGSGAFDVVTADFNRDGRTDVAVSNADHDTVSILLGGLDASIGLIDAFTFETSASPRGIVAGDFIRDGHQDLAVVAYDCGCLNVARNDGSGLFTVVNTIPIGSAPEDIVAADFNRDGTGDVVIGKSAHLMVFLGADNGAFVEIRDDSIGFAPRGLSAADFDRNGRMDVAVVGGSALQIWHDIPSAGVYGRGTDPDTRGVVAFDVNSDGAPDVATASRTAGRVLVLPAIRSTGGGIGFHNAVPFATGAGARAIATADFDRDGRDDLVVANQYARTVSLMRNQTPRFPPTTTVY